MTQLLMKVNMITIGIEFQRSVAPGFRLFNQGKKSEWLWTSMCQFDPCSSVLDRKFLYSYIYDSTIYSFPRRCWKEDLQRARACPERVAGSELSDKWIYRATLLQSTMAESSQNGGINQSIRRLESNKQSISTQL